MKKTVSVLLVLSILLAALPVFSEGKNVSAIRIRMKFEDGSEGFITDLRENSTTQAFLDMLPMTIPLNDWDGREYWYSETLPYDEASVQHTYAVGEFTYWCGGWITAYYNTNEDTVIEAGSVVIGIMDDVAIQHFSDARGEQLTVTFEISESAENVNQDQSGQVFQLNQVYESETEGTIHYNLYVPDHYDGSQSYALHIALPGWEGLYFQGVGEDLHWEYLPTESPTYVSDMIVVSAQLNDWGQTSARQAVALTEHMLSEYNIDPDRVYITGYSGGGETLSLVMEMKPELFTAALFVSSRWDGDPAPLVKARTPLYLFTAEHDSYYGSNPVREAYQCIHDLYVQAGMTEEDIVNLLVMDIRSDAEMDQLRDNNRERTGTVYAEDYHGAGMLAAFDRDVMQWLFSR